MIAALININERGTDREIQTETDRERQTDRQQTETEAERERETGSRQTKRQIAGQTGRRASTDKDSLEAVKKVLDFMEICSGQDESLMLF